jgi:hypothetical protein
MLTMPLALSRSLVLTTDQKLRLQSLTRAHSTPQVLVFRCRLILRAGAPDRPTDMLIAAEMDCSRRTVGLWRKRFLAHGIAGLQDAPRSGKPRRFSPLGSG